MRVSVPVKIVEGIVSMAICQKRTDWQVFSKKKKSCNFYDVYNQQEKVIVSCIERCDYWQRIFN